MPAGRLLPSPVQEPLNYSWSGAFLMNVASSTSSVPAAPTNVRGARKLGLHRNTRFRHTLRARRNPRSEPGTSLTLLTGDMVDTFGIASPGGRDAVEHQERHGYETRVDQPRA